jgi:hypothetical protein
MAMDSTEAFLSASGKSGAEVFGWATVASAPDVDGSLDGSSGNSRKYREASRLDALLLAMRQS